LHAQRLQVVDRGADIGLDPVWASSRDVRRVDEVVASLLDACGAAEVVECDRREAALCEA